MNNRIKELRIREKLTQKQLGHIVNVTQQSISQYETTDKDIPLDIAFSLAEYFQVSISYLLGKSNNDLDVEILNKYYKLSLKDQKIINILIDEMLKK